MNKTKFFLLNGVRLTPVFISAHFAVCPSGSYGPQCQQECMCANGAMCDHVSGACTCTSGWRNTFCDKRKLEKDYWNFTNCWETYLNLFECDFFVEAACPDGYYGLDCSSTCSCGNGAKCDHVTGDCSCPPGWVGDNCNERK